MFLVHLDQHQLSLSLASLSVSKVPLVHQKENCTLGQKQFEALGVSFNVIILYWDNRQHPDESIHCHIYHFFNLLLSLLCECYYLFTLPPSGVPSLRGRYPLCNRISPCSCHLTSFPPQPFCASSQKSTIVSELWLLCFLSQAWN